MLKLSFQGPYCTFSKSSLSLTHCGVKLSSFSFGKFFRRSNIFRYLVDPFLLGSILLCIHSQKCTNHFFENFWFPFFCIHVSIIQVLSNLKLRVERVNFRNEGFECKNCLSFRTVGLVVFNILRAHPRAAPLCVYNRCSFRCPYCVTSRLLSLFRFGFSIQIQICR